MAGITKGIQSLWKALPTPFSGSATDAKTYGLAKLKLLVYPAITAGIVWGCYSLWRWRAKKQPPSIQSKPNGPSAVQNQPKPVGDALSTNPPPVAAPAPNFLTTSTASTATTSTSSTPAPILPTTTTYLLSDDLFQKAKACIDDESYLADLLATPNKDEPIYCPKDIPVVLKKCGSSIAQKRVERMRSAWEICEKNNYKHLTIPQVQSYKDFTIETRLPITLQGTKEQIGLYVEHREKFTEAIRCFTELLFQTGWSHITASHSDLYALLFKRSVGRYDHFTLILEENGQGKIALTNFKYFTPHRSNDWIVASGMRQYLECRDAICFFPYHFQEIVKIAKKFEPSIDEKLLFEIRDASLTLFKSVYENHLIFIQEKGITFSDPYAFAEITPARKEVLKQASIKILQDEHQDWFYKGCLGENPEQTIKAFEAVFPDILNTITQFIINQLNQNKKEPISSYQYLLSCRSLIFYEVKKNYHQLKCDIALKLTMLQLPKLIDIETFSLTLIEGIFAEMVQGKEIAYHGIRKHSRANRHVIFL